MWKGTAAIALLAVAIAYRYTFETSILPSWMWNWLLILVICTILFLGFLISFVNIYIGKDLRKCSPLNEHLAYVNEETQSSQCITDLDKVASSKGLRQTWRDEIEDKNAACRVLLTGVTGYVGKAFLFQLLREISEAQVDGYNNLQHKIYIMIRPKHSKGTTASQRLDRIKRDPMFSSVRALWDSVVVAVQSGDLQVDQCGLSPATLQQLADAELTHVVHCAADVNFNRALPESAGINITPVLQLLALAKTWPSCKRFVHVSTAFVNPGCGSPDYPLPEKLFPLGQYNAQDLYDSMRGDTALALEAKAELKFPNNYVFSKCIAEHLLVENNREKQLKIIRPAIIGPAWVLPEPGWNGEKPSTITALFLLWGTRVIRFAPLNSNPTPMVPVDVVVVAILDAMISPSPPADAPPDAATDPEEESGDKVEGEAPTATIQNLTWSHTSPHKFVDGMRMAKSCIPVGVLKHHFTATEAALSYALIDASTKYPCLFQILHRVFNLGPLKLLQFVCWLGRVSGIKSILDQLPVTKLLNFSDMLYLYRPYLSRAFFFESSYNVPPSLSMNQYCISLFTATHAFWKNLFPGTVDDLHELELLPEGRWDLWWALTVSVSFRNRIINYLACKIIRETYGSVELNFVTLFHAGRTMLQLEETMNIHKHCVVLTPPCRSLMDYIMVKYVAFSMLGLGIDVPRVYAEPEFNDPKLKTRLGKTKARFDRHAVLAAFLEGSPSSDGRLKRPHTKFLKDLVESPGHHKYTLIPLCIDYDCVDINNEAMKRATRRSSDIGLLKMIRLYWRVRSCGRKRPCFGDIRISFGVPTSLEPDSDFHLVAKHVQSEHRRLTTVSEYQISKAEIHLNISKDTLRTALEQLGTRVCSNKSERISQKTGTFTELYSNHNDLWRLHLQWMPRFAPYLADSHPKWAHWIMGGTPASTPPEEIVRTNEIYAVLRAICVELDAVEGLADRAATAMREEKGSLTSLEGMVKKMIEIDPDTVSTSGLPICQAAASFILDEL